MKENFGEKQTKASETKKRVPWRKLINEERREIIALYGEIVEMYEEEDTKIEEIEEAISSLEMKLARTKSNKSKKAVKKEMTRFEQQYVKEKRRLEEIRIFKAEKTRFRKLPPEKVITKDVVRGIRREMSDEEAIQMLRQAAERYESIYRRTGSMEAFRELLATRRELIKLYEIARLSEEDI